MVVAGRMERAAPQAQDALLLVGGWGERRYLFISGGGERSY